MIIFKRTQEISNYLADLRQKGVKLGYVPTMGALHAGHLSLIEQSRKLADQTICSIFVNPVQFNNVEDFNKYPSTLEMDIIELERSGCDVLFLPAETEIYPDESSR